MENIINKTRVKLWRRFELSAHVHLGLYPSVWNSLPYPVKASPTLSSFKRALKTHYFQSRVRKAGGNITWQLDQILFHSISLGPSFSGLSLSAPPTKAKVSRHWKKIKALTPNGVKSQWPPPFFIRHTGLLITEAMYPVQCWQYNDDDDNDNNNNNIINNNNKVITDIRLRQRCAIPLTPSRLIILVRRLQSNVCPYRVHASAWTSLIHNL